MPTVKMGVPEAELVTRLGVSAEWMKKARVENAEINRDFNMVRGDKLVGRNIRVKCQVRPGLISAYRGAVQCPC